MTDSGSSNRALDLAKPLGIRAEMARRGILPHQMMPYEDPERGFVDPYFDQEMRGLILGFLSDLNKALIEACSEASEGGK